MTPTQRRIVDLLRDGRRLMWFGDNGPQMEGFDFWPQKRSVRSLIAAGVLRWGEPFNETQRECGIYPVELNMNTTERQILFSEQEVLAILDGRKTVTRRIIKPKPTWLLPDRRIEWTPLEDGSFGAADRLSVVHTGCDSLGCWPSRYGQPGDRLWVPEAWAQGNPLSDGTPSRRVAYRADGQAVGIGGDGDGGRVLLHHGWIAGHANINQSGHWMGLGLYGGKWRPSIHMPRWASRITLEITGVRVERLQEITEADAEREGVEPTPCGGCGETIPARRCVGCLHGFYRDSFRVLWDKLNSKRGFPWESNPWVWRIEFRRLK